MTPAQRFLLDKRFQKLVGVFYKLLDEPEDIGEALALAIKIKEIERCRLSMSRSRR